MKPKDSYLASALSKLRTKPIPEIHENSSLKENLLTQLVGIITSNSLEQQCVDYSCRALERICKRLLETSKDGGAGYGFALKLLVEFMFVCEDFNNLESCVQIADAAYSCSVSSSWTVLFEVVVGKLEGVERSDLDQSFIVLTRHDVSTPFLIGKRKYSPTLRRQNEVKM